MADKEKDRPTGGTGRKVAGKRLPKGEANPERDRTDRERETEMILHDFWIKPFLKFRICP